MDDGNRLKRLQDFKIAGLKPKMEKKHFEKLMNKTFRETCLAVRQVNGKKYSILKSQYSILN